MTLSSMTLVFVSLSLLAWLSLRSVLYLSSRMSRHIANDTEERLGRLFVFTNIARLLSVYVLVVILCFVLVLWWFDSAVLAILLAAGLLYCPRWIIAHLAIVRRRRITSDLPDALLQMSGAMRAGATLSLAIQGMVAEQKGPLGQEFSLVLREQRLGARLDEALENLGNRVRSEDIDLVITAALIATELGGNLSETFTRLASAIRSKQQMEGKIRALTSQGVLQGYVVSSLPFLLTLVLWALEPEAMSPLITGLLGWCFLLVIVVMQVTGYLVIRNVVRIEI